MIAKNVHGLSRAIPTTVKREVRKRSRFGCVNCRCGFYQYEHIDPPFEKATIHDPSNICCLCGSCHDAVTRGRLSKALIKKKYLEVQNASPSEILRPSGPLDFHDGKAELKIGGLIYSPAVNTILRYHGVDLIRVNPGNNDEPGSISATFTDDNGIPTLWLTENEWQGSLDNWDIDVVGSRLTVKRQNGRTALQLRLEPPGLIVVEKLDMRFRTAHLFVTEHSYWACRYVASTTLTCVHVFLRINRCSPVGAAIEFTDPETLEMRHAFLGQSGQGMATSDGRMVLNSNTGCMFKNLGIVIASLCGSFDTSELIVLKDSDVESVRKNIFRHL